MGRFLQIALGSTTGLEHHLLLARDLHFLKIEEFERLDKQVSEIRKMLISLIQKVRKV
jgi:four helix bundle protein